METFPMILSAPILIALILVFIIPSVKNRKRILSYYSSGMVKVVYIFSVIMIFTALVFAGIYFIGFGDFKETYSLASTAMFSLIGFGLIISNAWAVSRSKKIASGGEPKGKSSKKKADKASSKKKAGKKDEAKGERDEKKGKKDDAKGGKKSKGKKGRSKG